MPRVGTRQSNNFAECRPAGTRQRAAEFFLKLRRVPDHDTRRRKLTLPSAADLALNKAALIPSPAPGRRALSLFLSFLSPSHLSLPQPPPPHIAGPRLRPGHRASPRGPSWRPPLSASPRRRRPRPHRPPWRPPPPPARPPRRPPPPSAATAPAGGHCRREEEEAGEKRGEGEKRGGEGEGEEKEGAGLGPSTLTPLRSSPPSSPTLVVAILVAKVCPTPVVVSSST